MDTGKAEGTNNRQALLAEMLGMMAHLGNDIEHSPSGANSHWGYRINRTVMSVSSSANRTLSSTS